MSYAVAASGPITGDRRQATRTIVIRGTSFDLSGDLSDVLLKARHVIEYIGPQSPSRWRHITETTPQTALGAS